jgi:hypothetical protein
VQPALFFRLENNRVMIGKGEIALRLIFLSGFSRRSGWTGGSEGAGDFHLSGDEHRN